MTFEERICSAYPLHTQLISTLTTTSHASNRALAATHYIYDLRSRIEVGSKNLKSLRAKVHRLRSEYEVLRDGHAKRLLCKVSGKTEELEAKTSDAENVYQGAFEEQARAAKDMETLYRNLRDANQELLNAKDQDAIHKFTILELDSLHTTLFSPTAAVHSPSSPTTTTSPPLPSARPPYAIELRAHAQIHSLTSGPIAQLRQQTAQERAVLTQLCEARKSLIWAHAALLDAEDAARYGAGSAVHEWRGLSLMLVRTTLGVAQCHAARGVGAYEAARRLRAAAGRNGNGNGNAEAGPETQIQPLKEMGILKEMCLMSQLPYSPSISANFSPGSRLASTSGAGPNFASGSESRAEAGPASSSNHGRGRGGGSSSSSSSSIRRLLEEKDLAARVAECKGEMKPAIMQVRREASAAEERVGALEEGRKALESEARDILRSARIRVVDLVVSGEGDGGGDGGEGSMEEEEEVVRVFMGGPPDYTP